MKDGTKRKIEKETFDMLVPQRTCQVQVTERSKGGGISHTEEVYLSDSGNRVKVIKRRCIREVGLRNRLKDCSVSAEIKEIS